MFFIYVDYLAEAYIGRYHDLESEKSVRLFVEGAANSRVSLQRYVVACHPCSTL